MPTGGEGRGEEQTLDAASDGTLEDQGDTGEAEETGQATREIVIFIDLAPEPEQNPQPGGTIYFRGMDPDAVAGRAAPDQIIKPPFLQWYGM